MRRHCNKLQHPTIPRSALQHTATHCNTRRSSWAYLRTHWNALRLPAIPRRTLQHKATTATLYNTKQPTATHCNTPKTRSASREYLQRQYNTLQHTTAHCNTLQHTTAHCNTLQHKKDQELILSIFANTTMHFCRFSNHIRSVFMCVFHIVRLIRTIISIDYYQHQIFANTTKHLCHFASNFVCLYVCVSCEKPVGVGQAIALSLFFSAPCLPFHHVPAERGKIWCTEREREGARGRRIEGCMF